MEKTVITNETRIADILQAHPETADVFSNHGLGCFVCMGASMETIEDGALMHGLDVNVIVEELNKAISG